MSKIRRAVPAAFAVAAIGLGVGAIDSGSAEAATVVYKKETTDSVTGRRWLTVYYTPGTGDVNDFCVANNYDVGAESAGGYWACTIEL